MFVSYENTLYSVILSLMGERMGNTSEAFTMVNILFNLPLYLITLSNTFVKTSTIFTSLLSSNSVTLTMSEVLKHFTTISGTASILHISITL